MAEGEREAPFRDWAALAGTTRPGARPGHNVRAPCAKGGGPVAMCQTISYIGIPQTCLSKIFYSGSM